MASPFRVFRKNRELMIVGLILLAMLGFIILPMLGDMAGSRTASNPVVVTTTQYGDLHEQQLHILRDNRRVLNNFMSRIGQYAAQQQKSPYVGQYLVSRYENFFGSLDEEAVVNTWLLTNRAEELGLVVSKQAVNEFLRAVTTAEGITQSMLSGMASANGIGELQVMQILSEMQISQDQLFDLLKRELLSIQLRNLFSQSLAGITPDRRWDYFQRLNRKVTAEVLPVPVVRFVTEVSDPNDATLKKFFDQYKDEPFVPDSAEPGFLVPKQIAIEYFKADYARLTEIAPVSDEEVAEYYESNKDQLYRQEKLPETPEEKPAAETSEMPANEPAATEQPAEEPAAEEKPEEEPAKEPAAEEKPTEEAAKEPAAEEKPDEEPAEKPAASDDTSSFEPASRFHLTAMQVADESDEADAPPKSGEAEPAEKKSAEEPVAYKPLDEVADEIRQRLASEKVRAELNRLRDKLARYRDEKIVYDSTPEDERQGKPAPPKPDIAQLAKENRLSAHTTPLISAYEAAELDLAGTWVSGQSFIPYAFETMPEYGAAISQDGEGNLYLAWKVQESQQHVANWNDPDTQDKVRRAWKMIEARKLATAEAERLAGEARSAGKSLATLFGDQPNAEVMLTEPFTWLTYGSVPGSPTGGMPRIGQVEAWVTDPATGQQVKRDAVEMPGDRFMRVATRLDLDEVGVAINAPETIVYVVRVTELGRETYQLYDDFLKTHFSDYYAVAQMEQQSLVRQWFTDLQKSAGLKWQREPERQSRR